MITPGSIDTDVQMSVTSRRRFVPGGIGFSAVGAANLLSVGIREQSRGMGSRARWNGVSGS